MNYLHGKKLRIIEGTLRCNDLKEFLHKVGASTYVWLSEDGSGVNQKITYDVSSNKLVGLTLPLSEISGMPITSSFVASSLNEIEKHMKNQPSTLVYLIIAQPIKSNSPPFVLQIFGSNNKFSTEDVINRWKYTKEELKK